MNTISIHIVTRSTAAIAETPKENCRPPALLLYWIEFADADRKILSKTLRRPGVMFCPDCGTDNSKNQRFCTRCGSNLVVIDRARDILNEMTSNASAPVLPASTILRIVGLVATIGFLATTGGVLALMSIDEGRGPIPVFFGIGGFGSMVLICRYLLNMLKTGVHDSPKKNSIQPVYTAPTPLRGNTNRSLQEGNPSYQSVIEDPTRQFEHDKR